MRFHDGYGSAVQVLERSMAAALIDQMKPFVNK